MLLPTNELHAPRGSLARANPVAKVCFALAVPLVLILSVDLVSAATALLLQLLVLPLAGIGPVRLLRTAGVVLLGALPPGVLSAVVGPDRGAVLVQVAGVSITEGSLLLGAAISLRVLAIGLPGVVLVATTDPTDLADALAQLVRLPARFVLAALAALQLATQVGQEWTMLGLARRARGLQSGPTPAGLAVLVGRLFALFVVMIRRAVVLATSMEARGLGVAARRTWARPSRWRGSDTLVALLGPLIGALALSAAVLTGQWSFVLS